MPSAHSSTPRPSSPASDADRGAGRLGVERHAARERPLGVEPPEDEVGVGHRRLGAAAAVAGRSRLGTGRARADAQRAARVAPADRPAACADGVDVDHRQRDRPAADLAARRLAHRAVLHDADVARRAAHVEAQEVGLARPAREQRRGGGAAGRAAEHGERRVARGLRRVGEPAAGLHDRRLGEARLLRAAQERLEVGAQERAQRGVDLRRRRALELAEGADDLVREADVDAGQPAGERLADRALVLRVAVGVQQDDGHRLRLRRRDRVGDRRRALGAELAQHAVRAHALRRRDAAVRRHERRRVRRAQPVEVGARLAAELDDVGEALGRDERGPRAGALEQRVGRHGHAVREGLDPRGVVPAAARRLERGADGRHHALGLVAGRRGRLRGDQPPAGHEHGVGERAADVHPQEHRRQAMSHEDQAAMGVPRRSKRCSSCSVSARCWCDGQ